MKAAITGAYLGRCLLAIWLLGVGVMAFRLGLSVWRVSRIVRRSTEVPTTVIEEFRGVAAALGCEQAVRVVQTSEVPAPCLTGLFQPWLLLPEASCEEVNRADLRAILAHELAHARRHDLVWNVVLHFWSILLWCHPLVWRIRAAHLAACDAVCDALAVDLVDDVASYGQTLARLALQAARPARVPGLAMARTPDVFVRIETLQRRVFRSALPWRLIAPALLALGAVDILIGGFGITRADQPPTRKASEPNPGVANADRDKNATQPASSQRLSRGVPSSKGVTAKGRVVDESGTPVKGAQVATGPAYMRDQRKPVVTDEFGEYTLRGCEAGPAIVTAQAEGFGREFREVIVSDREEVEVPVIRLGKPSTFRARVVDRAGKPVAGAYFAVDSWRGPREPLRFGSQTEAAGHFTWNAQADDAGSFIWTSAPSHAVLFVILKDGYQRKELLLTASGQERVTTLDPELVISGSVTDAVTGKPVPRFHVTQGLEQVEGRQGIFWWRVSTAENTGGRYSTRFDTPTKESYVRVEAPGYEPDDSRAFRSDEGAMIQDFRLKPAAGISGVVLLPDGRPAAGVQVVLGTRDAPAFVRGGVFQENSNAERTTTGPDGRFSFPKHEGGFLLVVAADSGFADATSDEIAKTGKLVLQPWGRIEGEVRIGRKPASNGSVVYLPEAPRDRGGGPFLMVIQRYDYHFESDSQGRFAIDRVIPGRGRVARVLANPLRNEWCGWEPVEVKPSNTTQVRVGGKGRPVIGRVVLDRTPLEPVDWQNNEAAVLELPGAELKPGMPWRRFASGFDEDGRFRIEDVAPGSYELRIPVSLTAEMRTSAPAGTTRGETTLPVTVPEGPDDQAVEVGDVKVRLYIRVGDLAPDFTAPRLDGGQFRLSEQRGKVVLLDFWATWSGSCLAEMPAMKDIQTTFGGDSRFVLVGLTCDDGIERPPEYVKANALTWTQGFAGKMREGLVAETYLIRAVPATFLIGSNGRVVAMNLRGVPLKEAVRKALSDAKLFSGAK